MTVYDCFNQMKDIGIVKNHDSISLDNISAVQEEIKYNINEIRENDIYLNDKTLLSGFMDSLYLTIPELCNTQFEVIDDNCKSGIKIKQEVDFGKKNGVGKFAVTQLGDNIDSFKLNCLQYKFIRIVEHYFIRLEGTKNTFFIPSDDFLLLYKKNVSKYNIYQDIKEYILPLNDIRLSWNLTNVAAAKAKDIKPLKAKDDIYISVKPVYTFIRKPDSPYGMVESFCGLIIDVGDIWNVRYLLGQIFNYIPSDMLKLKPNEFMLARYLLYRIKLDDPKKASNNCYNIKMSTILKRYYSFINHYQKNGSLFDILPVEHNKNILIADLLKSIVTVSKLLLRKKIVNKVSILRYNSSIIDIYNWDMDCKESSIIELIKNKRKKLNHKGMLYKEFCGDIITVNIIHEPYKKSSRKSNRSKKSKFN